MANDQEGSLTTDAQSLRAVTLFHDLSEQELGQLSRQTVYRRFNRGEIIFSQDDPSNGLYIVVGGHISIGRQNADGAELILAHYAPGEYFGELALFDDGPRSAGATAVEDCTVLFLSRDSFRSFLELHPSAVLSCLRVLAAQLRRCTDLVDDIALYDIRSRLARHLLRLSQQGIVTGASQTSFHITQQQLANMMAATRESVNKHLNALAAEGILQLERGHIEVLDLKRLEACSVGLL